MKYKNKNKGITLIALVITIIILLILAGVTIGQLTGNGLFEKVKLAKEKWDEAQKDENATLEGYESAILGTSGNINIKEDLEITIEDKASIASIEVSVKPEYENAVYIYIMDNKIVKYTNTNSVIIENLKSETDYEIVVIVVEENQNIHRGTEKWTTKKENATLEGYESAILGTSGNINIKEDLEITIEDKASIASIEVSVKPEYENAVYIYIMNNKIVKYTNTNSVIIENLKSETDYEIVVIVVEGNQNIHRETKKWTTKKENVDVYGKIQNSGKSLADFGISYTRQGSSQRVYDELYKLGMGSNTGIQTNTFTLTIDYDTLLSQCGNKTFSGIYGQFYQIAETSHGSYTSWVESKIIVNYEDGGTPSEASTQRTSACSTAVTEELDATVNFEKDRKVKTITMTITEYDSNYGSVDGWIENIRLIP